MRGEISGLDWMICAQILILATVGLYAFGSLLAFDEAAILALITPELRNAMDHVGLTISDLQLVVKPAYYGLYLTVIGVTFLFQGGLAFFYFHQRSKIVEALARRASASTL